VKDEGTGGSTTCDGNYAVAFRNSGQSIQQRRFDSRPFNNTRKLLQFQDVNSEGLAIDSVHAVLYVSDRNANEIYVWRNIFSNTITNSTPPSLVLGAFFAGAHLNEPAGLFVDSAGTLWCADQYNFRVVWWTKAYALTSAATYSGSFNHSPWPVLPTPSSFLISCGRFKGPCLWYLTPLEPLPSLFTDLT